MVAMEAGGVEAGGIGVIVVMPLTMGDGVEGVLSVRTNCLLLSMPEDSDLGLRNGSIMPPGVEDVIPGGPGVPGVDDDFELPLLELVLFRLCFLYLTCK